MSALSKIKMTGYGHEEALLSNQLRDEIGQIVRWLEREHGDIQRFSS